MPREAQFGLFVQDDQGTLWRGFFNDLDEAKRKAQELADLEGFEFFIYDFKTASEITRFFPRKPKPRS